MAQTLMTLAFGTAADARVPNLGASGAIAAVLGASRLGTYSAAPDAPNSRVRGRDGCLQARRRLNAALDCLGPCSTHRWFWLTRWRRMRRVVA